VARDFERLVVAALGEPRRRKGHGYDELHARSAADALGEQSPKERGERKLAAELERLHENVGRKAIRERRDGRVVVRRTRQAAPADRTAGRVERAARAELRAEPGQVGVARRAEQALVWRGFGRASAQVAGAAEDKVRDAPRDLMEHGVIVLHDQVFPNVARCSSACGDAPQRIVDLLVR